MADSGESCEQVIIQLVAVGAALRAAGTGKAAEFGVLFKGAKAIENASKLQTIVFDKTGTLTKGEPSVTDLVTVDQKFVTKDELRCLAAVAEKNSEHPLGEAIVRGAIARGIKVNEPDSFKSIPGHGVEAALGHTTILLCNRKLMKEHRMDFKALMPHAEDLEANGKTVMFIAAYGQPAGLIAVAGTLKENTVEALQQLHKLGIETVMITGDNRLTAKAIARKVGIDTVLAEVLPQDKAEEVKKLQAQGRKVAMVGDGVNDAPALAQADVGLAIGSGTDVAKETGDVILIKDDIRDVVVALEIARATMRKLKQNLFWAFVYNTLGVPLGAGLFYPFASLILSPELAGLVMAISSVSVTLNTLLLKGFKPSISRERKPKQGSDSPQLHPTTNFV
jgi:Cu+-exporting ATPase